MTGERRMILLFWAMNAFVAAAVVLFAIR